MTRGVTIQAFHHTEALNMQIKRLLDDREVLDCDRLPDAQGRSYAFVGLYELEMLGRELGLISGGIVGREPAER